MSETNAVDTTQFLTFQLDDEIFALDIGKVREVLEFNSVTKVPRTPEFMRGVINLRGSVVPVVDMRLKFGMTRTEKDINTCIIIVEIVQNDEVTVLGALADSVQEVMNIGPDQIEPPPRIGAKMRTDFLKGMGKTGDDFVLILDIDKVFSTEELAVVQESGMAADAVS